MKKIKEMDQYLKGNLSEEEMEVFTKKLVKTYFEEEALKTKWKKLLADDKELLALKHKEIVPLSSATLHKKKQTAEKVASLPNKKRWIRLIGIAASLLLLLAGWFIVQPKDTTESPQYASTLVDTYLATDFDIAQTRKNLQEEARINAMRHYEAHRYKAAAQEYEQLIQTKAGRIEDHFNLGYIYLKSEEWDKASTNFTKVMNHPMEIKIQEARWFASLAFIKNKEPKKAIGLLEDIVRRDGWQAKKAGKILASLRNTEQ